MKEKTYSVKWFDKKDSVNRYCITWKNKRAETALIVPANMPNHINFLEELLIDENYDKDDSINWARSKRVRSK